MRQNDGVEHHDFARNGHVVSWRRNPRCERRPMPSLTLTDHGDRRVQFAIVKERILFDLGELSVRIGI